MEFVDVGNHCEYANCNQQDFLPFRCTHCSKSLCLAHRALSDHECPGIVARDMTSIDCPICGKSVKFDKSQDINVVWDDHYMNSCSHEPTNSSSNSVGNNNNIKKCIAPNCRTILRSSNTFRCPKCWKDVCISHRIAEDHKCSALTKHTHFLDRLATANPVVSKDTKRTAVSNTKSTQKAVVKKQGKPNPTTDIRSQLKETAHRRKQDNEVGTIAMPDNITAIKDNSPVLVCPFCDYFTQVDSEMVQHVNSIHPDGGSQSIGKDVDTSSIRPATTTNDTTYTNSNTRAREVCPVCQQRFVDPIDLVNHFESSHSGSNSNSRNVGSSGSNSGCYLS